MFTEIVLFLLDTVFTLFGMALLLRLWMQLTRLPSRNPVSQGVFQVTDWIVRPLRRIMPGFGGIDWATLIAAYLTAVLFLVCRALVLDADPLAFLPVILALSTAQRAQVGHQHGDVGDAADGDPVVGQPRNRRWRRRSGS